ncbi:hypothetical protein BpHYR1_043289 [Brachionus plicatilis]|uniref:Uncharacterized protein n=1 Tax=Brachionus plicatilis TaxID=10195 RepID=A0A3M7PG21_BRAPC|nr:hypothetical protein BpHYR1_043289 [Brachionus plicatilis]
MILKTMKNKSIKKVIDIVLDKNGGYLDCKKCQKIELLFGLFIFTNFCKTFNSLDVCYFFISRNFPLIFHFVSVTLFHARAFEICFFRGKKKIFYAKGSKNSKPFKNIYILKEHKILYKLMVWRFFDFPEKYAFRTLPYVAPLLGVQNNVTLAIISIGIINKRPSHLPRIVFLIGPCFTLHLFRYFNYPTFGPTWC